MTDSIATVFVPATIGNVGPGFDILGLAVSDLGDEITVELRSDKKPTIGDVTGRDHELIPTDASKNCAAVAACSLLDAIGDERKPRVSFARSLPLAGGMGSSAAASVGGALAAWHAAKGQAAPSATLIMEHALVGEKMVAGSHLDNIAPCVLGGLTLCLQSEPPDVHRLPLADSIWISLVNPAIKIATEDARKSLRTSLDRSVLVHQTAAVAALITGLASGQDELLAKVRDQYAEQDRKQLIPGFDAIQNAAYQAGASVVSISGAGPTIFAISRSQSEAEIVTKAMQNAAEGEIALTHTAEVCRQGAKLL